jgi:hypothetical protein
MHFAIGLLKQSFEGKEILPLFSKPTQQMKTSVSIDVVNEILVERLVILFVIKSKSGING